MQTKVQKALSDIDESALRIANRELDIIARFASDESGMPIESALVDYLACHRIIKLITEGRK